MCTFMNTLYLILTTVTPGRSGLEYGQVRIRTKGCSYCVTLCLTLPTDTPDMCHVIFDSAHRHTRYVSRYIWLCPQTHQICVTLYLTLPTDTPDMCHVIFDSAHRHTRYVSRYIWLCPQTHQIRKLEDPEHRHLTINTKCHSYCVTLYLILLAVT